MAIGDVRRALGERLTYHRRIARMTQQQLADAAGVHVGTVRKLERGARGASDEMVDVLAAALKVDPGRLMGSFSGVDARVHEAMPSLSAVLATYDAPEDGPVRAMPRLRAAVDEATTWRLAAQYVRISQHLPALLAEVARSVSTAPVEQRAEAAALLVSAARTADAVAYKFGSLDLSARLIDLMRWAAPRSEDPLVEATTAYVRTEVFFAASAYGQGLRALETALGSAPRGRAADALAARGALHMRAAVIAGRARQVDAAKDHLAEARRLADDIEEGVYSGTAFGPDSVRTHEVALAVSLGGEHAHRALDVAQEWSPPATMPAERRSGFYIELARAQLWVGQPSAAFESLLTARQIAPQHTREHPWVRQDAATLRRLRRADMERLSRFAEWCHAGD